MLTQNLCDQARKRASGVGLILFVFLLTACGTQPAPPAAPTSPPTETPTPQPTLTPTPTETPVPTPTPIPTLPPEQVGGLSGIPDPKISNPELFDLTKPDAPIPQFVNAMRMGGIEIDPEEVANNLQYQTITGADGKQYIIGSYYLDPNPNQTGEILEGPIPLVMWSEEEGWREVFLRSLADIIGINIGLSASITNIHFLQNVLPDSYRILNEDFKRTVLGDAFMFIPYGPDASLFPRPGNINIKYLLSAINSIRNNRPIMVFHLIAGGYHVLPRWLTDGNYTKQELRIIMVDYITKIVSSGKGRVDKWVVVNEPFGLPWSPSNSKFWHDKLGPDTQWIIDAFQAAHSADPNARLVLNDWGIEIPGEKLYDRQKADRIFNIAQQLKDMGIPIEIGFQMHLYGDEFTTKEQIITMQENFRQSVKRYTSVGIPVNITEWDIRLNGVNRKDRYKIQAEAYKALMRVALEEGVEVNFFGDIDKYSWLEDPNINGPDAKNADPTLRDDFYNKKPAWYGVAQAMYSFILK